MAWTEQEVAAVRAAVVALATGARVAAVTYAGPPSRSVQYAPADLPQLRSLLAEMERSVTGAPRFRRAGVSKGFYPRRRGSDG